MQITFLTCKFRNKERNLHCDVVHITTKWVSSLTLDCNGVFAIKAYSDIKLHSIFHMEYKAIEFITNKKESTMRGITNFDTRQMALRP